MVAMAAMLHPNAVELMFHCANVKPYTNVCREMDWLFSFVYKIWSGGTLVLLA